MTINTRQFDSGSKNVGNSWSVTAANTAYSSTFGCAFNYLLQESDFFTGSLQFIYIVQLVLSIDSLAKPTIPFRDSTPFRYDLGEYSWTVGGSVLERGRIESLKQTIVKSGRTITISKNEAARFKLSKLSERPRLLISKSAAEGMKTSGAVAVQPLAGSVNAALATVPPGVITGTVTSASTFPTDLNVIYPRREFVLDSTDGILNFTTTKDSNWYNSTQLNTLSNISEPNGFGLWLPPGVTGTLQLSVIKAADEDSSFNVPYTVYAAGALPAI